MNANSEITSLKEHLLYIDKTDDRHFIDKIVELYEEGVDEQTLQSIFWQRYEIEDWLRDKSLEGKDYAVLYKENEKGKFRSTTYKTEDVKQVWLSTLVDEDEDVTINMPTSFEEAHMLGMVGWCFCDNEGWWIQHTYSPENEGYGETIYFIHNILQSEPDDYVSDLVKPNGNHEIINRTHHHLDISRHLQSLGDMVNKLLPVRKNIHNSNNNKQIKENKKMNKKQTLRLNEGQLKRVVAETVKNMLKEYYGNDSHDGQLTVGELIDELQKCDPNERVEIYVGNDTFHCISNVFGCYLFKNGMEYKEWKQREEEAEKKLYRTI